MSIHDIVCNIFVRYLYIEIKAFVLKKSIFAIFGAFKTQAAPHNFLKLLEIRNKMCYVQTNKNQKDKTRKRPLNMSRPNK